MTEFPESVEIASFSQIWIKICIYTKILIQNEFLSNNKIELCNEN